jgi:hypothetical protein
MKRERSKLSRHNEVAKAMDYMLKRIFLGVWQGLEPWA